MDFQTLRTNQFLILSIIKKNTDITNYLTHCIDNGIITGYEFHYHLFTTHIYFRSTIIDLCALFENKPRTQKNNFFLYNAPHIKPSIEPEKLVLVNKKLKGVKKAIENISTLRNKEYAHKDMIESKIPFSLEELHNVTLLTNIGVEILSLFGGYDFQEDDEILSLRKMIEG